MDSKIIEVVLELIKTLPYHREILGAILGAAITFYLCERGKKDLKYRLALYEPEKTNKDIEAIIQKNNKEIEQIQKDYEKEKEEMKIKLEQLSQSVSEYKEQIVVAAFQRMITDEMLSKIESVFEQNDKLYTLNFQFNEKNKDISELIDNTLETMKRDKDRFFESIKAWGKQGDNKTAG